jgi:hypothetical protein
VPNLRGIHNLPAFEGPRIEGKSPHAPGDTARLIGTDCRYGPMRGCRCWAHSKLYLVRRVSVKAILPSGQTAHASGGCLNTIL